MWRRGSFRPLHMNETARADITVRLTVLQARLQSSMRPTSNWCGTCNLAEALTTELDD